MEPNHAGTRLTRAIEHLRAGRLVDAESSCRSLLHDQPRDFAAHYYLAVIVQTLGRLDEAEASYRRALEIEPALAEAHADLGVVLQRLGRVDEAIASFRRAIECRPDLPEAHNNLGNSLFECGKMLDAAASYRRALELRPGFAEVHNNLGNTLQKLGRAGDAIESFRAAARLNPQSPDIFNNLGNALKEIGRLDEAIACYDRALTLSHTYAAAHANLANTLKDAGHLDQALASYDRALALRPHDAWAHSGKLYAMHFHPDYDPAMILQAHRQWNLQHARPLAKEIQPHRNDRATHRPLRIGYVSPDLRDHVIGRFLHPLLSHHDRGAFQIVCYSDGVRADAMTERLRRRADVWRSTAGLSDARLAALIRDDRIDILLDLTLHMGGSRLLAFARKPAPVQATYLAYCSTTGLETMDYRLSDPYLDPVETDANACYTEKTVRLARSYWCYEAAAGAGDITLLPALSSGPITFGCLNNFCKISPPTLDVWLQILHAVPGSRLILHALEGTHRRLLGERMATGGIDPARIEFVGLLTTEKYFEQYQRIDIALDPFPYTGGTTTCDALWMGIPVVTLPGKTAVSRGGVSILSNLGLTDLIAADRSDYVRRAVELAGDIHRLCGFRQTLRPRMMQSPLMDARRFTLDFENALRMMWAGCMTDLAAWT